MTSLPHIAGCDGEGDGEGVAGIIDNGDTMGAGGWQNLYLMDVFGTSEIVFVKVPIDNRIGVAVGKIKNNPLHRAIYLFWNMNSGSAFGIDKLHRHITH